MRSIRIGLTIGALCLGSSNAFAAEREVSLLTVNAWGLPAPIAPPRKPRLADVGRWITGRQDDFVAMQEVWDGAVKHMDLPGMVRSSGRGDDGLAFRTSWTVESTAQGRFERARGWDGFKQKGWLRAQRRAEDGTPLCLVVTHMQAGKGRANGRVRASQVVEVLEAVSGCEGPLVVMGDFNLDERRPEDELALRRLTQAGLSDAGRVTQNLRGTWGPDAFRFDRAYVRGGDGWAIEPRSVEVFDPSSLSEGRAPTDHAPVRVVVSIKPTLSAGVAVVAAEW